PQTVIELARSENRERLSRRPAAESAPVLRSSTGAVRAKLGAAMVRWGERLGAGRTTATGSPRRLAPNALR
ncbi:MAG: hypothetical protein M3Y77_20095, partial [Actinomycetota bacterium]|nr:hypothetical protein [Actinomycetota bacterium]